MAELLRPAFKDPHYGLVRKNGSTDYAVAQGAGTPTALSAPAAGYAPGCLWINTSGAVGSFWYCNTGTNTVAVWTNVI